MKLTVIQLGDGIYEAIRKRVVEKGYYPEISNYYPNNKAGFELAKEKMISDGKDLIEVYNVGNWESRQEKNKGDIIIDRLEIDKSSVGKPQRNFIYEQHPTNSDIYNKKLESSSQYDVMFQITYITDKENYSAIIEEILLESLGNKKLLTALSDTLESVGKFWVFKVAPFDTSGKDFIERGYRYQAKWIDLEGPVDIGIVPKFKDFESDIIAAFSDEVGDINNFLD